MIPMWLLYFFSMSLLANIIVLSACMAAGAADQIQRG